MAQHITRDCRDRKEDKLSYKLVKVVALIAGVSTIAGATVKVLSYEFVQTSNFTAVQRCIDERFEKVENNQTRVSQQLDDISSDVKEIRRAIDGK